VRAHSANNRIRLAVIGCNPQSARVLDAFVRNGDVQWVAGCDSPANLRGFMMGRRNTFDPQMVADYRRILDRADIDAVLVGAPAFSDPQVTIDAVSAGKDLYVENPAARTIEHIRAMLDAARRSTRVIQFGFEQRSGIHVAEAKTIIDSGLLGHVRHVAIVQHGGGLLADAGAPHVDIAHWFMKADRHIPRTTAAVGLFLNTENPAPAQEPDTFSISWEYDNFVMTFANGETPCPADVIDGCGTLFIGANGSLHVSRTGYALRRPLPRAIRRERPLPPSTAGHANASRPDSQTVGATTDGNPLRRVAAAEDALARHVRNFLDCVRSRRAPNADVEIGYHSTLPCLLALESMRRNAALGWDAATRMSTTL
jgi:predicted dehydrogenase